MRTLAKADSWISQKEGEHISHVVLTEGIDTELDESFRRGSTDGDHRGHTRLVLLHAAPRWTVPAVHGWVCTSLGSSSTPLPVSSPHCT